MEFVIDVVCNVRRTYQVQMVVMRVWKARKYRYKNSSFWIVQIEAKICQPNISDAPFSDFFARQRG
jgi:hypothetical protein